MFKTGVTYPGLASDAKIYLWKTAIGPVLKSGVHCMHVNNKDLGELESFQNNHIKRMLGFFKRSHHSKLLIAIGVENIENSILNARLSLYHRIFKTDSVARDLNLYMLRDLVTDGTSIKGTLIDHVRKSSFSPVTVALRERPRNMRTISTCSANGVVDSLHALIFSEGFNNVNSKEHELAQLLVSCF